jgi:hypothetical protein
MRNIRWHWKLGLTKRSSLRLKKGERNGKKPVQGPLPKAAPKPKKHLEPLGDESGEEFGDSFDDGAM